MKDKWLKILTPILTTVLLLILWQVSSMTINNEYVFPSFFETVIETFKTFTFGEFYTALFSTLLRSFIGGLSSFLIALILALTVRQYEKIKGVIDTVVSLIRGLPTIGIILILTVWTDTNVAPVIVTMLVVLPISYTGLNNSINSIDKKEIEMCYVFGVERKDIVLRVVLPQIAPDFLSIMGSGLSLNLKLMVAAEVLALTPNSIGNYMQLAKIYDKISTLFALLFITVIIGVLIDFIFNILSKKVGKWK